jgi:aminopeptidase N
VPGTNLTREEAADRARLVSVSSYEVELDLTVGSTSFGSTSVVHFTAEPGSATFADLVTDGPIHEITLNGRPLDPAAVFADSRIALDGLEAENVLRVHADCQYSHTGEGLHRIVDPVDGGVPLHPVRGAGRAPRVRRLRAARPQGDLPVHRDRAGGLGAVLQLPHAQAGARRGAPRSGASSRRSRSPRTSPPSSPGTTASCARTTRRRTARSSRWPSAARKSLMEYLDADEIFDVTFKGFDYFQAQFDHAVPVRQVRPAVRAGVQRGRDGERGRGHLPRGLRLPQQGHRRRLRARAETILHEMAHMWFGDLVTMRGGTTCGSTSRSPPTPRCAARPTRPSGRTRGPRSPTREDLGLPQDQLPSTHPIAADIPDLEAVEVNFDGITYAKGASVLKQLVAYVGDGAFLAGLRTTSSRTPGATPRSDLLGALEKASGRDLSTGRRQWLQTAGLNTLRPEFTVGRRRHVHRVRGAPGGGRAPRRANCARTGSRSASTTTTARASWSARPGRGGRGRRAHRACPSWSACRAGQWCCSTTTT